MMRDGFVSRIKVVKLVDGYFALKAAVKPRTSEKDPISGNTHYHTWVILSDVDSENRSKILSAYCPCKGG